MEKYTYLNYGPNSDISHRLKLIKDNGFDGVFLWYDKDNIDDTVRLVKDLDLKIETFHLPYKNCNHLWLDDELGNEYINNIEDGIKSASYHGVKTVIIHNMSGQDAPKPNSLGINRIKNLLDLCSDLDVNLAVENVRDIKYANYIFDRIKHQKLKMCLDFGHTQAFAYTLDDVLFDKYGSLITCVHISDNHGHGDEHLVPFMGNINYQRILENLEKVNYKGPLTSEAHWHNLMPEEEFITLVYKALCKLEMMFGKSDE